MDTTILLNNIERLLRANKTSAHAVSKKAGSEDAIRNLRRYAAGEIKGSWTLDTLEAVARALDTTSWELLKPPATMALDAESQYLVRSLIREELSGTAPRAKAKRSR
jgi:hypothetical protein